MSDNKDDPDRGRPTESEILDAIGRSGYLMDQEVATTLEDMGFHVQTSWPFEDPDEGQSRELDVWAVRRITEGSKPDIFIELFCECKGGEDRPFVFISRRKGEIDQNVTPMHYIFPQNKYEKPIPNGYQLVDAFRHLECAQHHYWFQAPTKAVQLAKIVPQKKKWEAQHDGIYNSLLLPLAKALIHQRRQREQYKQRFYFCFPIVILRAPIYQINTGTQPLAIERVPYVSFYRELDAKSVKGEYITDFVTLDALPQMINERIVPFANAVATEYRANPNRFLVPRHAPQVHTQRF